MWFVACIRVMFCMYMFRSRLSVVDSCGDCVSGRRKDRVGVGGGGVD